MKTLHKVPLELVEVEFIPPQNEMDLLLKDILTQIKQQENEK